MNSSLKPKYEIIPIAPKGVNIYDRPAPDSQGALKRRAVANGTPLQAYDILMIGGVPYAYLVPQVEGKPEYVRVAERDGSIVYCKVIDLPPSDIAMICERLERIATALENK
jgi:hypothetical protein